MKILFFLVSLIVLAFGVLLFSVAKSAIHEIEAFLLLLIGTVFMCTAAILEALQAAQKQLPK